MILGSLCLEYWTRFVGCMIFILSYFSHIGLIHFFFKPSVWHQWGDVFWGAWLNWSNLLCSYTMSNQNTRANGFPCYRNWFLRPILDLENLNNRLNAVSFNSSLIIIENVLAWPKSKFSLVACQQRIPCTIEYWQMVPGCRNGFQLCF